MRQCRRALRCRQQYRTNDNAGSYTDTYLRENETVDDEVLESRPVEQRRGENHQRIEPAARLHGNTRRRIGTETTGAG